MYGKKFTVRLTEQELADLITKHLMDPKGANVLGNFIKGVLGDKSSDSTSSTSDSKGPSISGNDGTFTALDLNTSEGYKAYKEIADKFIDSRSANLLGITGSMLADSAKKTFNQYKKYVPAELALAQLATEEDSQVTQNQDQLGQKTHLMLGMLIMEVIFNIVAFRVELMLIIV
ncbi:hypothetical protein CCP3SC5AM1_1960007 [Gammaproteobacteria bacterium]